RVLAGRREPLLPRLPRGTPAPAGVAGAGQSLAVRHRADATRYRDRRHAGQVLGWRLVEAGVLERFPEPRLVLGLPRGGVPVAGAGATVVVVDDGLATGASMRAALHALGAQKPAAVVVAVPVGSPETCRILRAEADEVICVRMPDRFLAVGQAYDDFSPTTD